MYVDLGDLRFEGLPVNYNLSYRSNFISYIVSATPTATSQLTITCYNLSDNDCQKSLRLCGFLVFVFVFFPFPRLQPPCLTGPLLGSGAPCSWPGGVIPRAGKKERGKGEEESEGERQ